MTPSETQYPSASAVAVSAPRLSLSPVEFIALIALMMALTAMSIDLMLPALPAIGAAMGVADANDRQIVIISYVIGFALGQLGYGRLSDKYGRKPVLMSGLALFIAGSLVASLSSTFHVLLGARVLQGLGAAAPRVIAIAIVRDLYVGRRMARVMSFAMTVFIIIPVLAPSIGQGLLELGTWRWSFDALLGIGLVTAAWTALRLPETREEGAEGEPLRLGAALKLALETPQTIGYALAAGFLFGCLMSYVSTAQQVFVDIFRLGDDFPLAFGAIASLMALASVTNANLVERLGMRRLSHTALTGFVVLSILFTGAAAAGVATLRFFVACMGALFFLFGLVAPNFNALAMEPQGHNAGLASSIIGFVTTGAGAVCGGVVGHLFNGTVLPLTLGFSCLSLAAFAAVLWVEGPKGLYHSSPRL
jgi:DHA1 family bicyclomycin/chloramphenicol resistance-like MFS transporter